MGDFDDFDFDEPAALGERDDVIPCRGSYRGIGLHDKQSAKRLKIVRGEIDKVYSLTEVTALFEFACDVRKAPEARLFSAAKLEAMFAHAVEKRWERPAFNRARLKVGGQRARLQGARARSHYYGTILDVRTRHGVRASGRRPRPVRSGRADDRP